MTMPMCDKKIRVHRTMEPPRSNWYPSRRTTYMKDRQGLREREQQRWVTSKTLLAAVVKVDLLDRSSLSPPRRK